MTAAMHEGPCFLPGPLACEGPFQRMPLGPKQGDLKVPPRCTPSHLLHSGHRGQRQTQQAPRAGAADGKAGVPRAAHDVTTAPGAALPSTCPLQCPHHRAAQRHGRRAQPLHGPVTSVPENPFWKGVCPHVRRTQRAHDSYVVTWSLAPGCSAPGRFAVGHAHCP